MTEELQHAVSARCKATWCEILKLETPWGDEDEEVPERRDEDDDEEHPSEDDDEDDEEPLQASIASVSCVCKYMDGAHRRTLERALQVVKSKERLAVALEMRLDELETYMAGEKPLPNRAFITAIDIVASGHQK